MSVKDFIYYLFIAFAALSAIGIVLVKNVLHAALLLMVCLLSLAGIYVLLHAEFIAVTQIMVYAGGVLVLIIFGIMLSSRVANQSMRIEATRKIPGFLTAAGILFIILYCIESASISFSNASANTTFHPIRSIGFNLMSIYVLPFEVAGILLLMSLIGAAITASFLIKK